MSSCDGTITTSNGSTVPIQLPQGYYSDRALVDAQGFTFYYYLTCRYDVLTLSRFFLHFPDGTATGSCQSDTGLADWVLSNPYNTCSPFQLRCEYSNRTGCRVGINSPPMGLNLQGNCDPTAPTPTPGGGSYGTGTTGGGTTVAILAEPRLGPSGADRPDDLAAELVVARFQEDARWAEGIA